MEKNKLKIWTNTEFVGHYPVGCAAISIFVSAAETKEEAAMYLTTFLCEKGLEDAKPEDMEEMPFVDGEVRILVDGNY